MSYPIGWDLVNITGTYVGRNGVPCVGSVTLSSPQLVLRSGTIVPAADIVFDLVNGTFSGQIPATDDPNASPVGWTYTVTENVPGGRQGYQIVAPHTSPGIDLSTVVPVTMPQPPTFGFPYVTLAQLAGTAVGDGAYLIGYQNPVSGSIASTVQVALQGVLRLKGDFGAVGDGVTNDGPALAAFFTAVAGKIGEMEPGTYLSNQALALPSNCLIRGAGMDVTKIKQGASLPTGFSFIVMGLNSCFVTDLTIDGNAANNTGFGSASLQTLINSTVNGVVRVKFTDWTYIALDVYGDAVVDACVFTGSGTTTITPSQYGIWYDNATSRVAVSNCVLSNIATNAIIAGGVSSITGCVFKGHGSYSGTQSGAIYTDHTTISCAIHGNIFQADGGHGSGVESNYGANVITGNYVTSQTAGGITLEGTGSHLVTGNTCTGCYDGVDIKTGASNFVVSGNNLFANTHSQINIEPGASNDFVIDANRLNGTSPLLDKSTGTTKTITNNVGFNPVDITGITVGASPFSYTNNLGYPILIGIENGAVSQVQVGGYTAGGGSNSQFVLPHGKTIMVTYSSAPSMLYMGV